MIYVQVITLLLNLKVAIKNSTIKYYPSHIWLSIYPFIFGQLDPLQYWADMNRQAHHLEDRVLPWGYNPPSKAYQQDNPPSTLVGPHVNIYVCFQTVLCTWWDSSLSIRVTLWDNQYRLRVESLCKYWSSSPVSSWRERAPMLRVRTARYWWLTHCCISTCHHLAPTRAC